jgi:antitoxin ParD1/3/4
MKRTDSISLGSYFEQFIDASIARGRYKDVNEVVRAALRLLEEEENKVVVLKTAVQEGIESGTATDFNPETHLATLKAKRNGNG